MLIRALPTILALSLLTGTASAQSSLGLQGLTAELGVGQTDDARTTAFGLARIDVMVTDVHGLQLDFGLKDDDTAVLGQLGVHFYMHPHEGQKIGLFALLSDLDGESTQYVSAGVEGRFALSPDSAFDVRFGIGGTTGMGGTATTEWDYVFAGAGYVWDVTQNTTFEARVDVTEYDEETFSAVGIDSRLRLSHMIRGSSFGVFGEVRNEALQGRDGADAINTVTLGATMDFGAGMSGAMHRPFPLVTPFDQLVTRGVVESF